MKSAILLITISVVTFGCQQQDCNCETETAVQPDQKWTWTTERFEAAVNKVRAGRDLTPEVWSDGGKVAVLLSFDVDNETVAWWDGEPTATDLSRGEYGSRVALKRMTDLCTIIGVTNQERDLSQCLSMNLSLSVRKANPVLTSDDKNSLTQDRSV